MDHPLISVIIPCYNASSFIDETLHSIIESTKGLEYEIIIINDGSTDNTESIIKSRNDKSLLYFSQENSGVSAARNNGLLKASGKYVIFFDADDLMSPGFLQQRIKLLESNQNYAFAGGPVTRFYKNKDSVKHSRGVSENAVEEIVMYHPDVTTCPSNYVFRHEFLSTNCLTFNTDLSSTADRFFLIQSACHGKVIFSNSLSPLLYRVDENSMSHKFSEKLVFDNEKYIKLLETSQIIPKKIRNKSLFLNNFILFASYYKIGKKWKGMKFVMKCLWYDPILFFKKCLNRIDL